jgi:hypothetical protein
MLLFLTVAGQSRETWMRLSEGDPLVCVHYYAHGGSRLMTARTCMVQVLINTAGMSCVCIRYAVQRPCDAFSGRSKQKFMVVAAEDKQCDDLWCWWCLLWWRGRPLFSVFVALTAFYHDSWGEKMEEEQGNGQWKGDRNMWFCDTELQKHAAIKLCFSTSSTELSRRWLECGMRTLMCWDGTIARPLSSEIAAEFAVSNQLKLFFLQTNKRDALELTIKLTSN